MPTVRLPEASEHNEMVHKIDAMLRDITKAPAMTQSARALGDRLRGARTGADRRLACRR